MSRVVRVVATRAGVAAPAKVETAINWGEVLDVLVDVIKPKHPETGTIIEIPSTDENGNLRPEVELMEDVKELMGLLVEEDEKDIPINVLKALETLGYTIKSFKEEVKVADKPSVPAVIRVVPVEVNNSESKVPVQAAPEVKKENTSSADNSVNASADEPKRRVRRTDAQMEAAGLKKKKTQTVEVVESNGLDASAVSTQIQEIKTVKRSMYEYIARYENEIGDGDHDTLDKAATKIIQDMLLDGHKTVQVYKLCRVLSTVVFKG